MGNFQKGGFRGGDRGGRGDFKKKSWGNDRGGDRGGDRDRGPITMHRAVCAECKRNCEVPFMPNGKKPVLCAECFGGGQNGGDRGGRSDFKDRAPRREFNERPSTESFAKPVQSTDELKKSINELTGKIDRLAYLFEQFTKTQEEVVVITKSEPVVEKAVIKKAAVAKSAVKKVVKKVAKKK